MIITLLVTKTELVDHIFQISSDGVNFQGMVNAEEILQDVEAKMVQPKVNIKKYQDLNLEVACQTIKIFSKSVIEQATLDNLWYLIVKTMLEAGVRRIGCWTDDTSAHPLVLKPDKHNNTDQKQHIFCYN